ncbi:MAG: TipAS antibiotic-recognition domain-containing protein, partial [Eubacterium sp.]|nr:TipAS antibiotic-recognition domain-containing protein [Eubacterium sp.]
IISSPDFDRSKALEQQIELLQLRKEHIENLIDLAKEIKLLGVRKLAFDAFDTKKMDEYAAQAKASWGTTPAYKEFEEKSKGRSREDDQKIYQGMIDIFGEFGQIRDTDPASTEAQALVKKLQDYITEHMYTCTKEILSGLGKMYAGGGDFTKNIDSYGGEGTAVFAARAIEINCG